MKRTRLTGLIAAVALVTSAACDALGAGMLIPKDTSLPPLAVKYLRVDTQIDNQVATTRVVQEFQNSTGRELECTYVFPVPKTAAIRDFAMYIGGKRVKGELLDSDKARRVYEEIVRRAKDPGLLEYMDGNLLRMRIFPVPARGTQKVELEYTHLVPTDDGLSEYVFPLRIGEKASKTLDDFTVTVRIRSDVPIKTVYSPTHEVGVARPTDHEAVAGMETKGALLDRDFQLFYTVGKKDFGLSLMTYRPDPKQPGMFLMLISPKSEVNADNRVPRDVVFVLDTSGSMKPQDKTDKIGQAKRALAFCIDKLDPKDRFAIVQFSTVAQSFAKGWTDASGAARKKAREWVEGFEAAGGTNFSETLARVFALPFDPGRPATVLFLTDGRPTVDVTDIEAIAKLVKDGNRPNLRVFTFGVGDDVNTKLLDRMSGDTGALTEYVRPGEAIDGKVTRLFSKMSHPVLTQLALEVPGVKITETYPRELPDLFRGSQVVLVGSYTGDGDSVIRLKGRVGKRKEEFVYEGTFPKNCKERSFIASLWAHRKIGYLLDQIRLHGENKELKDEVVRLSLAHGIETPYTSYLVLESAQQYQQYGITVTMAGPRGAADASAWDRSGTAASGRVPEARPAPATFARAQDAMKRKADTLGSAFARPQAGARTETPPPTEPPHSPGVVRFHLVPGDGFGGSGSTGVRADERLFEKAETGKTAVEIAQECQRLRRAENASRDLRGVQNVQHRAGRQFVNYRGVWVDERYQGDETLTKVKWGSEAYFQLVRDRADVRAALSQGKRIVVVTARGQAVAVDIDSGLEELTPEQMKALFADAPSR